MRRMITNKQVVNVVNQAIEDGEIEISALPEIESGDAGKVLKVNEQEDGVEWGDAGAADNVLVLPEEAPASQQLVGINTSGEQNSLSIGDGLIVENNTLNTAEKILTLNFNYSTSLQLTEEVATNINNLIYDKIIIENYYVASSSNKPNKLICIKQYVSELAYNGNYNLVSTNVGIRYMIHTQKPMYYNYAKTSSSAYIYGGYIKCLIRIRDLGLKIDNSYVATLANMSNEVAPFEFIMNKITLGTNEITKSGTATIPYIDSNGFSDINQFEDHLTRWEDLRFVVADTDLNIVVPLKFKEIAYTGTGTTTPIYYIGEAINPTTGAATYRYILSLFSNKSYTLTKVSV